MIQFDDDVVGGAECYRSLLRRQLVLGMDQRFFILGIAVFIAGAFSNAGLYSFVIIGCGFLVWGFGIAAGRISPYLLDELWEYARVLRHRVRLGGRFGIRFSFVEPDDAGPDYPDVLVWRKR